MLSLRGQGIEPSEAVDEGSCQRKRTLGLSESKVSGAL